MILVDLTYINSPGGVTLSKEILKQIFIQKLENQIEILLDNRNNKLLETKELKKTIIKKRELDRYIFYKKNNKNFKSILCFGNVPPPFKTSKKVYIYFHNELILNSYNINFSFFSSFIFYLKKLYIKNRDNNYNWIVQTNHIKEQLSDKLKIKENKIFKYPIYCEKKIEVQNTNSNTFIYPSSNNPHKNNNLLIKSFIEAALKTSQKLKLIITIEESDTKINKNLYPSNLEVKFLGIINHRELLKIYKKSKFLIFPSGRESFGLPLIEGIQAGCLIIAPKLNYVNEIISPAYSFESNNLKNISKAILESVNNISHPKQLIKVNNCVDEIFKKLLNFKKNINR
jgi:hypothetical protein